jgi:hypothetical protein
MMTTQYGRWFRGAALLAVLAASVVGCGGTGGGSGSKGNPSNQFVLNSSNSGRLTLNVNPAEVDANKTDRIGLVATLTDNRGVPIRSATIVFSSDIPDIRFIPNTLDAFGNNLGVAVTDSNGVADIIAVAGVDPTGTGDIIGTGALFAEAPPGFGLFAQVQVTLLDVGFVDSDIFLIVPDTISLGNPPFGDVLFFSLAGGIPPYLLQNESSVIGSAAFGNHCLPGCTENGGVLCVGSPCQTDSDCNAGGSPTPSDVCLGAIRRCLASCRGTNCAGARCDTDSDCNDGSPTPANVCKDSGQAIAYIMAIGCGNNVIEVGSGAHGFTVHDSVGASVTGNIEVEINEECDGSDLAGQTCLSQGFAGGSLGCTTSCTFDTSGCTTGGGGGPTATPGGGPTASPTPGPGATQTPTPSPTGPSPTPTAGVGVASNVELALLANVGADNGNATATCIVAATVTDINGNPVPDGTVVTFSLQVPTVGSVISSPSQTNTNPQCDVSNFEDLTMIDVLNQPGVAHACLTYPTDEVGNFEVVTATSGAGTDTENVTLPPLVPAPTPTP